MKKKLIGLRLGKEKISIEVYRVPKWMEGIGLMFHRREKARALLFEFRRPTRMAIHSFFVFFPFIAIWADSKNRVLEIKKVKPFSMRVLPSVKFSRLIEVPLNSSYKYIKFPSGKERFK